MTIEELEEQGISWGGIVHVVTWDYHDGADEHEFGAWECLTDSLSSATNGECCDERWYTELDVTNIINRNDGITIELTEF